MTRRNLPDAIKVNNFKIIVKGKPIKIYNIQRTINKGDMIDIFLGKPSKSKGYIYWFMVDTKESPNTNSRRVQLDRTSQARNLNEFKNNIRKWIREDKEKLFQFLF